MQRTWSTTELREDFEVLGFQAPYVVVRRKADNAMGSLQFVHDPRLYFGWQPHEPARPETDPCERGTVGCSVTHGAAETSCEPW